MAEQKGNGLVQRQKLEQQMIERAWQNESLRREMLSNPREVIARELGITIPPGVNIEVHEESANTLHFVLPAKPDSVSDDLSDEELQMVAAGSNSCPDFGSSAQACGVGGKLTA